MKQGQGQEGLADVAHDYLRGRILGGTFPPGSRLPDVTLAHELNMSRAPIREALRRLAAEHLVIQIPHRGSFVRAYSASDVLELFELRVLLEAAAIRAAIQRQADLTPLAAQFDTMREAAKNEDSSAFLSAEYAFHRQIIALSGNQWLVRCFNLVGDQVRTLLAMDNEVRPSLTQDAESHEVLLDLLRSAATDDIEKVLRAHIRWVPKLIGLV